MGIFPGNNGSGHGASLVQPQLLTSLVALAALPALAMLALWKSETVAAASNSKKQRGAKREARQEDEGAEEGRKDETAAQPAVVVVDPYSSGGVLARLAYDEGYQARVSADPPPPTVCDRPFALTPYTFGL